MFDKLKNFIRRGLEPTLESERMVEAAGATGDPRDEPGYKKITNDTNRDLSPLTRARMLDLAPYLWRTNGLAKMLIELPLAYLLAEGVSYKVTDPEGKDWLDEFWRDPINNMDLKLEKKVRELHLYGEQYWPVFVDDITGKTRLGYIDPADVATIIMDPDNAEQPIGVVTTKDKKGYARRFRVIINGEENCFTQRTQDIRAGFVDGDLFYFSINSLSNASHGTSDLLASADWLDAYDQAMFGELDRWDLMKSFIWDVELKNASQEDCEKRAQQTDTPSSGSIRFHNESEKWTAETPSLNSYDTGEGARLFRNHILGGAGLPEHWFGGGGDVNRSTGESMSEPTFKLMAMRQTTWRYILQMVLTFVMRQRLIAVFGEDFHAVKEVEWDDYKVTVEFPEMTTKDISKYALAIGQVVASVGLAIDRDLMTEETGLAVISIIAARLGVEIDPAEELEKVAQAKDEQTKSDTFQPDKDAA